MQFKVRLGRLREPLRTIANTCGRNLWRAMIKPGAILAHSGDTLIEVPADVYIGTFEIFVESILNILEAIPADDALLDISVSDDTLSIKCNDMTATQKLPEIDEGYYHTNPGRYIGTVRLCPSLITACYSMGFPYDGVNIIGDDIIATDARRAHIIHASPSVSNVCLEARGLAWMQGETDVDLYENGYKYKAPGMTIYSPLIEFMTKPDDQIKKLYKLTLPTEYEPIPRNLMLLSSIADQFIVVRFENGAFVYSTYNTADETAIVVGHRAEIGPNEILVDYRYVVDAVRFVGQDGLFGINNMLLAMKSKDGTRTAIIAKIDEVKQYVCAD